MSDEEPARDGTHDATHDSTQPRTPAQTATLMADAKGWNPEDGDELTGTVLGVKQGFSDVKNANYPIIFVLSDDGQCHAVHCFQTVLENEVRQQRPLPGERFYVKRIGPADTAKKGQSPVIRYAVLVERTGTDNDPWSHMDGGR